MTILSEVVEVFRKADKPVVFVGAGMSRSAPANIPLFREINGAVLSALDPDLRLIHQCCSSPDKAHQIEAAIVSMKPERLLGELSTMLGPNTLGFLEWMKTRQPSSGHWLIADVVNKFKVTSVLTTNFDLLLEFTLPSFRPVHKMKMLTRSRIAAEYELAFIAPKIDVPIPLRVEATEPAIFHLHGSISAHSMDITNANSQVDFDEYDLINLSPRLNDATILVVGYSGNDHDDVLPLLRRCRPRTAVWVEHSSNDQEVAACSFPPAWDGVFSEVYAVRGVTITALSHFADVAPVAHEVGSITDFELRVSATIKSESSDANRKRLLAWLTRIAGFPETALSIYDKVLEPG